LSACSGAGRALAMLDMEWKNSLPPELSLAKRWPSMSVIGGRAENICSVRVFLSLTHIGHWPRSERPLRRGRSLSFFSTRRPVELYCRAWEELKDAFP
jgi:hypothetical protein